MTIALLLLAACGNDGPRHDPSDAGDAGPDAGDAGPIRPPEICKDPPALGSGPWFTEMTDDVGVPFTPMSEIVGDLRDLYGADREIPDDLWAISRQIAGADLDGDGLIDLVSHTQASVGLLRDPMAQDPAHYIRRVLRAHPDAEGGFPTYDDVTADSGYTTARDGDWGRPSEGAIFGDVDDDGDVDILSLQGEDLTLRTEDRAEVLLNDGHGVFTLAPRSDPSADDWSLTSASFLDYDLDGILDVYLGYHYGTAPVGRQDRLMRGAGDGTFVDVTDEMGLTTEGTIDSFARGTNHRPTFGTTVCDVDRDGDPDILSSSYGRQLNMLWRNDGGTFVEIGRETGFASDDLVDYTDNEQYRCYCQETGACTADRPRIVCGAGPWWTEGWDDQPHRLGGNTFTTVCEDLDGDGDLDVVSGEIHHWWAGESADSSRPLLQEPDGAGGFRFVRPELADIGFEQPRDAPDWNEGNIRLGVFDFDCDGWNDVYLGASDYPLQEALLFRWDGASYDEVSTEAGLRIPRTNGMLLADLDHDGDRDVVAAIGIFRDPGPYTIPILRFFRNDVGQDSNWTAVRLHGAGPGAANGSGIGAIVEVTAGGRTRIETIDGGYGVGGMEHGLVAWLGLGDACEIDTLRVYWPDAAHSVTELHGVRANYYLNVFQDGDRVDYEVGGSAP